MKTDTTKKEIKTDLKVKIDKKLDKLKDIKLKSNKLDEINNLNFKLDF